MTLLRLLAGLGLDLQREFPIHLLSLSALSANRLGTSSSVMGGIPAPVPLACSPADLDTALKRPFPGVLSGTHITGKEDISPTGPVLFIER